MDFMIMMPLGPHLEEIWGLSAKQFGLLVSAYTISAGIAGLIGSFFIDRFDRKHALLFLYCGFLLGTFACAVSDSFEMLLLARCVTGSFGGLLGATVLSIVGDLTPLEKRSETMGVIMAAFSAASVFGVPFGLFLSDRFGWQSPFLLLGLLGIPVLVSSIVSMPNVKSHLSSKEVQKRPILFEAFSDLNQLTAHLFIILLMIGQFSVISFYAQYLVSNVGFVKSDLAYIYLAGGLVTLFTSPRFGRLSDKFGQLRFFGVITVMSLVPLWGITNLPKVGMLAVILVTTVMFVFISGRIIPAMTMITSSVNSRKRGDFMSVNSAFQQLGAGIASYLAGMIMVKNAAGTYDNYELVGYMAIAASLVAILVASRLKAVS